MIRFAGESDIARIACLEKDLLLPWNEEQISSFIASENSYIIAFDNPGGEIIAYLGYEIIAPEMEIANIVVDKDYRRCHYATRLLEAMIVYARARQISVIWLEVAVNNTVAIEIYEKFGFTKVSTRRKYYGEIDAYNMRLTL